MFVPMSKHLTCLIPKVLGHTTRVAMFQKVKSPKIVELFIYLGDAKCSCFPCFLHRVAMHLGHSAKFPRDTIFTPEHQDMLGIILTYGKPTHNRILSLLTELRQQLLSYNYTKESNVCNGDYIT